MKPPRLGLGTSLSVLEAAAAEMFSISDLKLNPFLGRYWGNIRVHIGVVLGYWKRKWKLRFSYNYRGYIGGSATANGSLSSVLSVCVVRHIRCADCKRSRHVVSCYLLQAGFAGQAPVGFYKHLYAPTDGSGSRTLITIPICKLT